ncbi:non-specific DNA binding protein [Saccharomyces pastorianus]|uniref:Non-specific DNA binding protein n=1 Tax=Saccharomyces pastorianus TaxID=27292 RepID=A0A6C1ED86_SACPS|nr:non-specific DNA binding protein [Saccharomyces pastorianus]
MAEVSKMTLKILYTLDNGSNGSYLARSKTPTQVRVANIPNPFLAASNEHTELRIGAIHLKTILHEIYLNSPEVLDHDSLKDGHDYNLYYRDICEMDEPLVSLGLLSKLRRKFHKIHKSTYQHTENSISEEDENEEDEQIIEEEDEDESFIVTGRVCSNFSALLRRSYSNASSKNGRTVSNQTPEETLEVKLRFSKVVAHTRTTANSAANSRRPSIQLQSSSLPSSALPFPSRMQPLSKANQIKNSRNARTTTTINNTGNATLGRRQTNPMPAPKAVRTQSLPIWNLKPNSINTGFPRNSIAHKIYLADRKTEAHQQNHPNQHQSVAYEINTLQNDNTIQKTKIDDSVSKRFDFMLNKKKPTKKVSSTTVTARKPTSIGPNLKQTAKNIDKRATAKVKSSDSKYPTKSILPGQKRSSVAEPLSDDVDSILHDILSGPINQEQKSQQKQKQHKTSAVNENDKENIPPQRVTEKENKLYDELDFSAGFPMRDFSDIVFKDEIGWLSNFDFFESPTSLTGSHFNQQNIKPSSTTPRDPNTCNTVTLENEDDVGEVDETQNNKIPLTSDADKTSPIDSLSIPLIELSHSSSAVNIRHTSLKEGSMPSGVDSSNNTPCDNDTKDRKTPIIDSDNSKAQPMLMNFSTPADQLGSDNNVATVKKLVSLPEGQQLKRSHETLEEEEEEEEDLKKQKAIPSSPCGMYNYHQPECIGLSDDMVNEQDQEQGLEDDAESDKTNDLFSTFVNPGRTGSQIVTSPISEYQSIKHQ